jgi:hypothetical protein
VDDEKEMCRIINLKQKKNNLKCGTGTGTGTCGKCSLVTGDLT